MPSFRRCSIVYVGKTKISEECVETADTIVEPTSTTETSTAAVDEPIIPINREPIVVEFEDYAQAAEYKIIVDGIEYGSVVA